jgi:hypothetical protein
VGNKGAQRQILQRKPSVLLTNCHQLASLIWLKRNGSKEKIASVISTSELWSSFNFAQYMTFEYFINHMLVFFNETTSNIIDVTVRGGEVVTIVCLAKRKQSIDMILEFVMTDE